MGWIGGAPQWPQHQSQQQLRTRRTPAGVSERHKDVTEAHRRIFQSPQEQNRSCVAIFCVVATVTLWSQDALWPTKTFFLLYTFIKNQKAVTLKHFMIIMKI